MKVIKIILPIVISAFTSNVAIAYAAASIPFGWYVDGNVGLSKITDVNYGSGTSVSNSGAGFNFDVGYKFLPYLGAEIGYFKYSDATIKNTISKDVGKIKNSSYDIAVKGILPIIDTGFEFFAKVGAAQVSSDVSVDHTVAAFLTHLTKKGKHTATSFFIGVGGEYSFIPNVPVNIQWQRANGDTSTGRMDLYSIGVGYILA